MKSCVLFSGGWDSMAVALGVQSADLIFFHYGQIYANNEYEAAKKYAMASDRVLAVSDLELEHDMERRNFYFIAEAKRLGYERVYSGSRNLLPWFDKYKDSNWLSLKAFGYLMNVDVQLPIVGWSKKKIVRYVRARTTIEPYNCYLNSSSPATCQCPNCREMSKILNDLSF